MKIIDINKRIRLEWLANDKISVVEWIFTSRNDNTTFVSITNSGFSDDENIAIKEAIGSTEGFTFVLAGLKALLEHNILLNLVQDRFPDGLKA